MTLCLILKVNKAFFDFKVDLCITKVNRILRTLDDEAVRWFRFIPILITLSLRLMDLMSIFP